MGKLAVLFPAPSAVALKSELNYWKWPGPGAGREGQLSQAQRADGPLPSHANTGTQQSAQ